MLSESCENHKSTLLDLYQKVKKAETNNPHKNLLFGTHSEANILFH